MEEQVIALEQYASVFDQVCFAYLGRSYEYLILLAWLREAIKASHPEINITLAYHKEAYAWLSDEKDTVSSDDFKKKKDYAWSAVRQFTTDTKPPHPLDLFANSLWDHLPQKQTSGGDYWLLVATAEPPVRSLTDKQIATCEKFIKKRNGQVHMMPANASPGQQRSLVEAAMGVVGVEGPALYCASRMGKATALLPTGIGEELYRKTTKGEVLPPA